MPRLNGSVASLIKTAEERGYTFEPRGGQLLIEGDRGEFFDRLLNSADAIKDHFSGAAEPPEETPAPLIDPFIPFPVDALPKPIRHFVKASSQAIGCDESYVALPLLSALAGSIGNSRCVLIKRGWTAPAILWTCCVGESGSQKTPPFRLVMRPLRELQRHAIETHAAVLESFEAQKLTYESDVTRWKRKPTGDPPKRPEPPATPRLVVSDATVEALASVLQGSPRGVLLARDELSGWFGSFDRYSKGKSSGDVSHWLSMHNGETLIVDRKTGQRLIVVPNASVSIAGGVQPSILATATRGELRESGLLARMLLAFPPPRRKRWTDADVAPELASSIERTIVALRTLTPTEVGDGSPEPELVHLSPEARSTFVEFYNEHAEEHGELSGDLAAVWSKLEEGAARLALVHHLTRWAGGEDVEVATIDADSMRAGVRLARWFGNEARRVLTMLDESDDTRDKRRLVEWVSRKGKPITIRDAQRGCRWLSSRDDAEAELNQLAKAGYGKWESTPIGRRGQPTRRFVLSTLSTVDGNRENPEENTNTVNVDSVDTINTHPNSSGEEAPDTPEVACNHQDPSSWIHREGAAYCRGCNRWMGRL